MTSLTLNIEVPFARPGLFGENQRSRRQHMADLLRETADKIEHHGATGGAVESSGEARGQFLYHDAPTA
jgi:hypothetical protein